MYLKEQRKIWKVAIGWRVYGSTNYDVFGANLNSAGDAQVSSKVDPEVTDKRVKRKIAPKSFTALLRLTKQSASAEIESRDPNFRSALRRHKSSCRAILRSPS